MPYTKIVLPAILSLVLAGCSTGSELSWTPSQTATTTTKPFQQATAEEGAINTEENAEDKLTEQAAAATPAPTPIVQTQSAELVAGTGVPPAAPQPATKTQLTSVGGQRGLWVGIPYQQAWAQTKKALPAAGYPIMEQDNTSGTYYVLDKVGSGGTIKRDTPIYQLHLQKQDVNTTTVTLNNAQNQPAADDVAQRILDALKNKLTS